MSNASNTLRILYISHLHPPHNAPLENMGGMQRVSLQLTDALQKMPNVVLKEITQEAPWKGIEWHTARFLNRLYWRLPGIIHHFKPDVILFSSMVTASLARLLRKKVRVPMITINHGQDVTLPVCPYQRFLPGVFRALDGVISVSRATREACIARGMSPEKGTVLPNGFDANTFPELPDRAQARKRVEKAFDLDLSQQSLIITVGRKVKRKGHAWFVEEILPRINKNVTYLTVGDGPEFENLQSIVAKSAFKNQIILAGRQPDETLKDLYAAADLFVMPNIRIDGDMEGFGVVMLEANSAGTAVVASGIEGILDVITEGKNGWLIPENQAQTFAHQIEHALEPQHRLKPEDVHNFVLERFAWKNVAQQYEQHLSRFIQN